MVMKNVWGWGPWDLQRIAGIVEYTAQREENVNDIIAGGIGIGEHRAKLKKRTLIVDEDVILALSLFCWWPLKPKFAPGSREYLLEIRWKIFAGASESRGVVERIVAVVPDELLMLHVNRIYSLLQTRHISELLRL